MKTLCLYYTRTDTTKSAMEYLVQLLDADIVEYTDGKDRSGAVGYIGACLDSMKKELPEICLKKAVQLSCYDRVIIGMPVWAEGPCVVGKAFISKYKDKLPQKVYYVVTHMGNGGYESKIKNLDELLGRPSSDFISIKTKDNDYLKDIEAFADKIKTE